MNRNNDGSQLTTDQLERIARTIGTSDEEMTAQRAANHNDALWESWLTNATRRRRWEMFCDGELRFDSSEPFVPKPHPQVVIDPWFFTKTGADI